MRKPNYRAVPSATAPKRPKKDEKLQRRQERTATRADDGAPEPTAENEPRET